MTNWLDFLRLFSEKNKHLTRTELLQKAKISFVKLKDYYEQYGGGDCSLCGSSGTNKSTCPRNPDAKNPNPAKHPNALLAAPVVVRASSVKAPAVPVVVRASSVNAPTAVPQSYLQKLTDLVKKVDQLGHVGKSLSSLTDDEIDMIIKNAMGQFAYTQTREELRREIRKYTHTPGWSCSGLKKDIEEDNVTTIYETVTVVFCGELGSWYVDESIEEIYEMLK